MGTDERAIRVVQAAWFDAIAARDLSRLLSLTAEDAVFLTPGSPPFGRGEYAAMVEAGFQWLRTIFSGELEEVVVAGEVAYARGRVSVSVTPSAGRDFPGYRQMAGYTLSVFRKLSDGRWVLARHAELLSPVIGSA